MAQDDAMPYFVFTSLTDLLGEDRISNLATRIIIFVSDLCISGQISVYEIAKASRQPLMVDSQFMFRIGLSYV